MSAYLITQATGQQSQWTITHLLKAGATVHAVVRNLQKVPPALKRPGITLFEGETTNFDAVYEAAQGCKGAFLNTFPIPGLEVQQAKTVVEACKKAGVETLVASTTFCTGNRKLWDTPEAEKCDLIPYYTSKADIEDVVRNAGLKAYTIVRPAVIHWDYFVPHAYGNFPSLPKTGELDHAFEEGARMGHTDGHDIGKVAAAALLDPTKFGGQEIGLGNENLTIEEARDILIKVSGREVRVRKKTPAEMEEEKATVPGQKFQVWAGYVDLEPELAAAKEVRAKLGITLTSLEDALTRDKEELLDCIPA